VEGLGMIIGIVRRRVVSGQGVQRLVERSGKGFRQKLVSGKELAPGRNPDAPHRTLLLPE
jgi:hypothetical protein